MEALEKEGVKDAKEMLASHCLVFYLVGLDGKLRHPVGFWFTGHDTAEGNSCLVLECLRLTYENGIRVRGMMFDGLSANASAANLLGANLKFKDHKGWFEHPSDPEKKVHIFYDACHMLKVLRNLLGEKWKIWMAGKN